MKTDTVIDLLYENEESEICKKFPKSLVKYVFNNTMLNVREEILKQPHLYLGGVILNKFISFSLKKYAIEKYVTRFNKLLEQGNQHNTSKYYRYCEILNKINESKNIKENE